MARIDVMKTTTLSPIAIEPGAQRTGLTHIAISVGSVQRVDELMRKLIDDGFPIVDEPGKGKKVSCSIEIRVEDGVPRIGGLRMGRFAEGETATITRLTGDAPKHRVLRLQ